MSNEKKTMEIELGHGNSIVTDIYGPDWAGISISQGECIVGEVFVSGAKTVADLEPTVTIVTKNPASLDVIIAACERAKAQLATPTPNTDTPVERA